MPATATVPWRLRLLVALALGALGGYVAYLNAMASPWPRDFSQVWYAAGAVLRHADPYALIGPGRAFQWPAPFLYPLPAAVLALPVASLSSAVACGLFMAIGTSALAWALMQGGLFPLVGLLSTSMLYAWEVSQWSPILVASVVAPVVGPVLVAKPTIGAAMFVARPSWWPVIGGLLLIGLAFALDPAWPVQWWDARARNAAMVPLAAPYTAPVMLPGGFLALLALTRWRRPEARLIAALACVPQTLLMYETVPLLLVPRARWEVVTFVALTWIAWWWIGRHAVGGLYATRLRTSGTAIVWLCYLPAVAMVLRRPNESGR